MDDELMNPVGGRPQNSYSFLGGNSQWLSRYCPSLFRSDRTPNRVPIITPTQPSSMATISAKYSRKEIAMIAGLAIGAGVMGYYVGNTCQMCTAELKKAQQYVGEMDKAFNACEEKGDELTIAVTYLTQVTYNLTMQVAECVGTVDDLKDAIIEYCLPKQ
jgi:hypothetical protein